MSPLMLRWRRLRHTDGERGTSLAELIVGMVLMSIFMGMFTGAVIMMSSSANKVEAVTISSNDVNQAFQKVDKILRYASVISTPGVSSTSKDWYVEAQLPQPSNVADCVQLRVDIASSQFQERTWTLTGATNPTVGAASTWQPLASTITNGNAAASTSSTPFVVISNATSLYQQLQVNVVSAISAPGTGTATASATFTALNSIANPTSTSVCTNYGRP